MDALDLSDFFTTKAQANDFSARLSSVAEKIYEVDFNLETTLAEQFGHKKKDKFISLLRENEIPIDSNSSLNNFFGKIKDTISSMSVATLTLAIEPDDEILKAISDWFLLNLKHQVLIEVQIDPDLIAGAAVNYQGKFHDASTKSIFDEISAAALIKENAKIAG